MKRAVMTTFPSKVARTGNLRYLTLPASVIERMALREGDYLDVTVSRPLMEEYDMNEESESVEDEKPKKRGRRPKNEEE